MHDISSTLANKNLYDTRSRRTLADQSIGSVFYRESDCCGYNFIMSPRHESLTCDLLNLWGDISDQQKEGRK